MGAVFPHFEEDNEVSSARPERLGCGRPGQRGCLLQVGEGAGQAVQDQGRVDHEAGHLHEELQQDGGAQQGPRSLLTTCSTTATASSRTLAVARRQLTPTAGRSTTTQLQPWATAPRAVATSGSSRTAGAQAGERAASSGSRGALGIADLASITMLHRTAPWVNKISFSQFF